MWHTEKESVLNELKNVATRWKLEVWDINSTLIIYKIAVYLWNSMNAVNQENYDFFRHPRNNICTFLILPKNRKNVYRVWLKKFEKTQVIKFEKKRVLGLTEIKFRSLFLKIEKAQHEKRVSLIYQERVTSSASEMHLRVPVETQQFRTVDLNWTCLFS